MKYIKTLAIWLMLAAGVLLTACGDEEIDYFDFPNAVVADVGSDFVILNFPEIRYSRAEYYDFSISKSKNFDEDIIPGWYVHRSSGGYGLICDGLDPGTTYYYQVLGSVDIYDMTIYDNDSEDEYYWVDDLEFTLPVKSFQTKDSESSEFIDMGTSVKWASRNLGAKSITDFGIEDKWWYGILEVPTNISSINISGTGYDQVTARMGAPYRTPTAEDFQELFDKCSHEVISLKVFNVNDYSESSKDVLCFTSDNGNHLYFPFLDRSHSERYWTANAQLDEDSYGVRCLSPYILSPYDCEIVCERLFYNQNYLFRPVCDK